MRLLAVCALALVGCGDDVATDDGLPRITDLACNPTTIVVGQDTAVACTVQYTDSDGDVDTIHLAFEHTDGTSDETVAAFDSQGATAGTAFLSTNLVPTTVGTVTYTMSVMDGAGHESNALSQDIPCVAP